MIVSFQFNSTSFLKLFRSLSISDLLWLIGFHSDLVNGAITEIGIYVIINIGNVNAYRTFFMLLQQIFFHSVIVVIASIKNIVKYKFNALCPSDNKIVDTLSLLIILTTIANILTIMLTYKRTLAGVIFINTSMAENLPFNEYLKSLLPYLPRICK